MSAVLQFPYSLAFFAPRDPPLIGSYLEYVRWIFRCVGVRQAWFLLYLFIFAQMFTNWFRAFHPAHTKTEVTKSSCCSSTVRTCEDKPPNCATEYFSFWDIVFNTAAVTPKEFVTAVMWTIGGPFRLALLPGVFIGVLFTVHNLIPFVFERVNPFPEYAWIIQFFPFLPYMAFFLLGYATRAADKQIRQDSNVWSRTCILTGTVLCIVDVLLYGGPASSLRCVATGFLRGIGSWLFLMGSTTWARKTFTSPQDWHSRYRKMAMPFYLTHQQINVMLGAGAMWIPYLRTLPVMLIITSFLSITASYFITKSGSLRYFFGLPAPQGSCLPGKQLRGFLPVLVLSGMVMLHILVSNLF